ncbi:MAG: ABC transporter ATP-binding protein/permease [Spirochaetaceae bacterium]|nr:ABC transporter ATP-binding protein/permease [Spirochaetaceae bacterium]
MLNKRILALSPESAGDAVKIIIFDWIALLCNAAALGSVASLIGDLCQGSFEVPRLAAAVFVILPVTALRFVCTLVSSDASFRAGSRVKRRLRERIYQKLISLGPSYHRRISTAEAVQLSGEGVDQMEIYFGRYLAQFFYSLLAPVTLFVILSFISLKIAVILLIAVPLIPITIALVQGFAKKLLSKYWTSYTQMGDSFLENIQGLDTLKIYGADEGRHREMNNHAENFRKITMGVLRMQLNSITVMDIIAYGGAAAAMILSFGELAAGAIDMGEAFFIVMIGVEFFIPMRVLGSYFHIAMNGIAAAGKMFRLFDLKPAQGEEPRGILAFSGNTAAEGAAAIRLRDLSFAYEADRPVLKNISLEIPPRSFIALVGESGSGKSTIAGILAGQAAPYSGQACIGGREITAMETGELMRTLTLVRHNSYLFAGTVRDNLLMGRPGASEPEMKEALERVGLWEFLEARQGLDTAIRERADNLSGGQRQRLALARSLLHDTGIYIFDEVSSNIDTESEEQIMEAINALARQKTVLLITHRLANVLRTERIAVLDRGSLAAFDSHEALLRQDGIYARMYRQQRELEAFSSGGSSR